MKTVEALASQLVAIPSYVSATCNEQDVIDFLVAYVRKNLPEFTVQLGLVDDRRSNLYMLGKKRPRIVFVGHVDTVQPSDGWNADPLKPIVRNERLYGLGVADMKGSIASLLLALQCIDVALLDEVAVLLYVDEEYQFAGMKQLLKDKVITKENQPDLVVSLDGGLDVLSGCRGLIKIDMEVIGKSGHASNPANGVNAITNCMAVMRELEAALPNYSPELGVSTMNIARLNGGAVADIDAPDTMQRAGNVIPNYAECIVELRTASSELDAAKVEEILRAECENQKLVVKSLAIKADLGVWRDSYRNAMTGFLKECYKAAGAAYAQADPQYIGFIDVQMLAATIDSPAYVIGAGGENRHGADENVPIANLEMAQELYEAILIKLLGDNDGKDDRKI
jgi:acetylornithine deacetylase/succinyl-diaminopimelate desuccinylase-like protein